jgi:hypothetical protein
MAEPERASTPEDQQPNLRRVPENPARTAAAPPAKSPARPKAGTKVRAKKAERETRKRSKPRGRAAAVYPRHAVEKALRIPRAILDQNAGRDCTDAEAAAYLNLKITGAFLTEISSSTKYGFLTRPAPRQLHVTERAKKVLRPQKENDVVDGLREAVLSAPIVGDVYRHYRGENLPDAQFFDNALTDTFKVPAEDVSEFKSIFMESLRSARFIDEHTTTGKVRLIDVSQQVEGVSESPETLRKVTKAANVSAGDSCFVLMPFVPPLGNHYSLIFEQAIGRAGLRAVRADADIFATGKIMDQVWAGINGAKVLVAELTSRNPNVFYELGIAHALRKPVVLVSSNEDDVPFDVRHIRVIYYDVNDPFWGEKLVNKVAENIVSALKNPEEAIFKRIE